MQGEYPGLGAWDLITATLICGGQSLYIRSKFGS